MPFLLPMTKHCACKFANSKCLKIFTGHTARITDVAVTTDGKFAISTSYDKTLRLWNLKDGKCQIVLTGDVPFNCCAIDRAEALLIVGDQLGGVHFFELQNLESLEGYNSKQCK